VKREGIEVESTLTKEKEEKKRVKETQKGMLERKEA
jgi:hypothetical protein